MRSVHRLAVAMGLSSMLCGCVGGNLTITPAAAPGAASTVPIIHASALSGRRQQVDFYVNVNPDCTSPGTASFDFASRPGHGTVFFTPDTQFLVGAAWPATNPRSKCNDRRLDGTAIVYTSEENFHGFDLFTLNIITPTGRSYSRVYSVSVR